MIKIRKISFVFLILVFTLVCSTRINGAEEMQLEQVNESIAVNNKEQLKENIDKADNVLNNEDSKYYTEDSLNTLKDNLTKAKEVFDKSNATTEDVENSVKDLDDATSKLEFNKQLIDDLLNTVNSTNIDSYTDEDATILRESTQDLESLKSSENIDIEKFKEVDQKVNSVLNLSVDQTSDESSNDDVNVEDTSDNSVIANRIILAIIIVSIGAIGLLFSLICIKKEGKDSKNKKNNKNNKKSQNKKVK